MSLIEILLSVIVLMFGILLVTLWYFIDKTTDYYHNDINNNIEIHKIKKNILNDKLDTIINQLNKLPKEVRLDYKGNPIY